MFPGAIFPRAIFPGVIFPLAVAAGGIGSVGVAAGVGTATGVSRVTIVSVGSASGVGTALGVSTGPKTGNAAGTSTALGVGQALVRSVGFAAGTSTAVVPAPDLSTGGKLFMEFNGFGGGWTEVKDWLRKPGISYDRGLPGSRILDLVAKIGTMSWTLDNSEKNSAGLVGYYSMDHANKRAGFFLNIRVRYIVGDEIRFVGTLAAADPIPGKFGPRIVQCEAVDWWDIAQRERLENLPIQVNKRGDEVFQVLLDSLPLVSKPVAVEKDISTEVFPYSLDRTRDTQTILRDEFYRISTSSLDRHWTRGDGTLVYESRVRRASISSNVDIFTDHNGFQATRDRSSVVNRVRSTVHPRTPSAAIKEMYSLNTPMKLSPGNPVDITGPWTDPENPTVRVGAVSLEPVTATVDYIANTLEDGTGADLTSLLTVSTGLSGNATTYTITLGGAADGFLTRLTQRGYPLYDYGPTITKWEDAASIQQYGLSDVPIDMSYQANPLFGLEVSQYLVYTNAEPQTQVKSFRRVVGFANTSEIFRSIRRDISDRISLVDPVTGLNRSFFINAIDETELDGLLITEWLLVPADSTPFWLLEVIGQSELDFTTRLGFGLIVGHNDVDHSDSHLDVLHGDVTHTDTHTDNPHGDAGHGDTVHSDISHGDVTHSDIHNDQVHGDSPHVDSHTDNPHGDEAHTDTHSDGHTDREQFSDDGPLFPHGDHHFDSHGDSHLDSPHNDVTNFEAHEDQAFIDSHSDVAHSDVLHSDVAHSDVSGHSDSPHGDVAHADVSHTDISHSDEHGDTEHGDAN